MPVTAAPPASAQWIRLFVLFMCGALASWPAFGRPPAVPAGATKAEVIQLLGWPNGQSKAGAREILSYAQGQVVLEDGRVTRVDFSPRIPWQAPKAAPAPASSTSTRSRDALLAWGSDFEQAKRDAARLMRPLLVLFTGPGSAVGTPRFFEDVGAHPDFVDAFRNEFVLMRVAFGAQAELQEYCEIAQYPTLVFLNPAGEFLGRSESFPTPWPAVRGRIIASVRDAWVTVGGSLGGGATSTNVGATHLPAASRGVVSWIQYAWTLIIGGVVSGIAIMLLLYWLLWRKSPVPQPTLPAIRNRISEAASGVPAIAEIETWSQAKVCAVAAGLAEADGYLVDTYKLGENADLELRHADDRRPAVLVLAVGSSEGLLPIRRLLDFTAEMESFNVKAGWILAPAGSSADAGKYARRHNITLLNASAILQRLRDTPPVSLPGVLRRTAAGLRQKR